MVTKGTLFKRQVIHGFASGHNEQLLNVPCQFRCCLWKNIRLACYVCFEILTPLELWCLGFELHSVTWRFEMMHIGGKVKHSATYVVFSRGSREQGFNKRLYALKSRHSWTQSIKFNDSFDRRIIDLFQVRFQNCSWKRYRIRTIEA